MNILTFYFSQQTQWMTCMKQRQSALALKVNSHNSLVQRGIASAVFLKQIIYVIFWESNAITHAGKALSKGMARSLIPRLIRVRRDYRFPEEQNAITKIDAGETKTWKLCLLDPGHDKSTISQIAKKMKHLNLSWPSGGEATKIDSPNYLQLICFISERQKTTSRFPKTSPHLCVLFATGNVETVLFASGTKIRPKGSTKLDKYFLPQKYIATRLNTPTHQNLSTWTDEHAPNAVALMCTSTRTSILDIGVSTCNCDDLLSAAECRCCVIIDLDEFDLNGLMYQLRCVDESSVGVRLGANGLPTRTRRAKRTSKWNEIFTTFEKANRRSACKCKKKHTHKWIRGAKGTWSENGNFTTLGRKEFVWLQTLTLLPFASLSGTGQNFELLWSWESQRQFKQLTNRSLNLNADQHQIFNT